MNPETTRPIKIGGRIWTRLVKKGVIDDTNTNTNDTKTTPRQYGKPRVRETPKPERERVPQARRRHRAQSPEPNQYKAVSKAASRALANNIDKLVGADDMESMLEQLILEELTVAPPKKSKPQRRRPVSESEEESESEEAKEHYEYY